MTWLKLQKKKRCVFYMLFLAGIITSFLEGTKRIGYISSIAFGVMEGRFFLLPVPTDVHFYDTRLPWAIDQSMTNGELILESQWDFGTKAIVMIPNDVTE